MSKTVTAGLVALMTPGLILVVVLACLLRGWVLSKIWVLVIFPTFSTLPVLSIPAAIGVSMTVSFITYQYDAKAAEGPKLAPRQRIINAIINLVLMPLTTLLGAWIISWFLP